MAMFETTKTAPMGSVATFRFVNAIDSVIIAIRSWRNARATSATLGKLSNAQLRDIGLERGSIDDVSRRLAAGRY